MSSSRHGVGAQQVSSLLLLSQVGYFLYSCGIYSHPSCDWPGFALEPCLLPHSWATFVSLRVWGAGRMVTWARK